jgi:hypothetical protein
LAETEIHQRKNEKKLKHKRTSITTAQDKYPTYVTFPPPSFLITDYTFKKASKERVKGGRGLHQKTIYDNGQLFPSTFFLLGTATIAREGFIFRHVILSLFCRG